MNERKNLELERLVFFSDAIVAIAITLLALDLRIENVTNGHLTFADLGAAWQKFLAFFLSFFIISIIWKIHHEFYVHIKKVDNRLFWYNIAWLMFIVILPFTTSLISAHLFDTAAIFVYCINLLLIALFQHQIWNYVAVRPEYLKESATSTVISDYRFTCNIAIMNSVVSSLVAFISPLAAFILLFARLSTFSVVSKYLRKRK